MCLWQLQYKDVTKMGIFWAGALSPFEEKKKKRKGKKRREKEGKEEKKEEKKEKVSI